MIRIGKFSKMAMTTVKTLRYYDEIGLLRPAAVDGETGYRLYSGAQLSQLHRIQSLRQAGLGIEEIRRIAAGDDARQVLSGRASELRDELAATREKLSRIEFILQGGTEEQLMSYSATVKRLPERTVYSVEMELPGIDSFFSEFPALGRRVTERYPDLRCTTPEYCYLAVRDREWRERNLRIEFGEAVCEARPDFDDVRFRTMPATDVVSVMHRGPYEDLRQAFAFALQWMEANDLVMDDDPRCVFVDGVWNEDDPARWLTEVQVPVRKMDPKVAQTLRDNDERYGDEMRERFGDDAYARRYDAVRPLSGGGFDDVMSGFNDIHERLAACMCGGAAPESPEAQALVAEHHAYMSHFGDFYTDEVYLQIGQGYASDPRFRAFYEKMAPGLADWLAAAITIHCRG